MPILWPLVSSRNLAIRPAAAPSCSSAVEPDGRPTSGNAPRTMTWSSSTVTSTPVNQPSGSLPANQPLIEPSSFSSMITTLRRNNPRCKWFAGDRGVKASQEAAGHGFQQSCSLKACLGCQFLPGGIREGVGDPWVASVRAVLDDDQAASWTEHLA